MRHDDGTVDVVQTGASSWDAAPAELEEIYWRELRGATLGSVRFARDAVRLLGIWPPLLRFGPAADGARPIVGGLFVRKPHGVIRWAAGDGAVVVAIERFAPLLRGPLWGLESRLHDLVGRRYLARAARRDG